MRVKLCVYGGTITDVLGKAILCDIPVVLLLLSSASDYCSIGELCLNEAFGSKINNFCYSNAQFALAFKIIVIN